VEASGRRVVGVGKIGDIFAHVNVTEVIKAAGNDALFDATLAAMAAAGDGDLVFTNFVDFDSSFGHRRDVPGYAAALEAFDRRVPEMEAQLLPGDLLLFTADHGCDPTWRGTDHTRERVPVLMAAHGLAPGPAGVRRTFADIAETIAAWLGLPTGLHGASMIAAAEITAAGAGRAGP
jgi:phosphopentomutase